jgi:hypothetical protein
LGALLAGAIMIGSATPAAAGVEIFLAHDMRIGPHWIPDPQGPNPEQPAVTCRYEADELERMTILQPVIFPYPGAAPGPQQVGWRAHIQWADNLAGPWNAYAATPVTTATATRTWPADLRPKVYHFPSNVEQHPFYRVVYRLLWYQPGKPVAKALHTIAWYRGLYEGNKLGFDRGCRSALIKAASTRAPVPPFGEGPHPGVQGVHWILDSFGAPPEYTAATCVYENAEVARVRVRRPIVFARDTGPGVQQQDVGWKAVIQTADSNVDPEWQNLVETSVVRRRTSDVAWADFRDRTVQLPDDVPGVVLRVVYRMYWYQGSSTSEANRAVHVAYWYTMVYGSNTDYRHEYCYTILT